MLDWDLVLLILTTQHLQVSFTDENPPKGLFSIIIFVTRGELSLFLPLRLGLIERHVGFFFLCASPLTSPLVVHQQAYGQVSQAAIHIYILIISSFLLYNTFNTFNWVQLGELPFSRRVTIGLPDSFNNNTT